jgi:dihydroorotase
MAEVKAEGRFDRMKIAIRNGRVIDPSQGIDGICDVLIEGGKIKEVKKRRSAEVRKKNTALPPSDLPGFQVIDAGGMLVVPGLVDIHVHLREPGFEYKETIKTGTEAAVRGGVTSVCCMPNTNPVNDNSSVTEFIMRKAAHEGACRVYPIGAITKGQKGEELAEMGMMHEAGCVAFSDDGRPVTDSLVMRRALEYSKVLNVPVISHSEDLSLSAGGVMNEGLLAVTLGLKGIPAQAEEIMVARDIALAELTGGRIHIAHVSTEGSVEIIRAAKKRGLADITAETCPHYFSITEEAVENYNTCAKVNPPLRRKRDVEAVKRGLQDGTIDVIATDHAPHHMDEKLGEFDSAPSGISGLETAIGLSMRLVDEGVLTLEGLIRKMALNPSMIVGINAGTLKPGADADLVVIETGKEYKVDPAHFRSKGKNTPFEGLTLKAKPAVTISLGRKYEWE